MPIASIATAGRRLDRRDDEPPHGATVVADPAGRARAASKRPAAPDRRSAGVSACGYPYAAVRTRISTLTSSASTAPRGRRRRRPRRRLPGGALLHLGSSAPCERAQAQRGRERLPVVDPILRAREAGNQACRCGTRRRIEPRERERGSRAQRSRRSRPLRPHRTASLASSSQPLVADPWRCSDSCRSTEYAAAVTTVCRPRTKAWTPARPTAEVRPRRRPGTRSPGLRVLRTAARTPLDDSRSPVAAHVDAQDPPERWLRPLGDRLPQRLAGRLPSSRS
jgi:hypothetical protein